MRIRFFSFDPDPATDPTLIRNKERNKYLYFSKFGRKFEFINHNFKLVFVNSGLYFVQDENNFVYLLLQVGSGSSSLVFVYLSRCEIPSFSGCGQGDSSD